jgi:hypothetical protein
MQSVEALHMGGHVRGLPAVARPRRNAGEAALGAVPEPTRGGLGPASLGQVHIIVVGRSGSASGGAGGEDSLNGESGVRANASERSGAAAQEKNPAREREEENEAEKSRCCPSEKAR